jgi:hypothetical protein
LCAAGIAHLDGAEGALQILGEPQRDRARRAFHGVADARVGMIQEGMRMRSADAEG